MTAGKKGFFNFFKGMSKYGDSLEDQLQRDFAKQQEQVLAHETNTPIESEADLDRSGMTPEIRSFTVQITKSILEKADMPSDVLIQKTEDDHIVFEIINTDDIGRIIGKDGNTLEAIQTVVRAIIYKKYTVAAKLFLDAGGYRNRKMETIRTVAKKAAKRVMQDKLRVELNPMPASDRRYIHMLFKQDRKIRSYSEGDGADRHIVLEYIESEAVVSPV